MSDQEKEDFTIQKSDSIIVAAKIENEFSTLQVYIYQETKNNLYVHHEITLSAFPLSLEWLSVQPKSFDAEIAQQGNYAIVSSFLPEIEIWDLDVINVIEPTIVLGGVIQQNLTHSKKPQKLKKKQGFKQDSHTDAVLNINLNQFRKNILASGSADTTVKVWDLSNQQCMATFNHHKDKVQVVQWNPKEEAILLSGGFDQKLHIFDARSPSSSVSCIIPSDIESALWDPINQFNIVFSTENGLVTQCDARKFGEQPVFSFAAHNQSTTSVSMSSKVPGLLCTTSEDGTVKAWDTLSLNPNPLLVAMKNPKAGQLFCGAFYDDLPWVFACGNSKGELFIWDSTEDKRIVEKFGSRVDASLRPKLEDCNAVIFETKPSQKEKNDKNEDDDDDDDDQGMRD